MIQYKIPETELDSSLPGMYTCFGFRFKKVSPYVDTQLKRKSIKIPSVGLTQPKFCGSICLRKLEIFLSLNANTEIRASQTKGILHSGGTKLTRLFARLTNTCAGCRLQARHVPKVIRPLWS